MKKRWFWILFVLVAGVGVSVWVNRPETPPTVLTTTLSSTRVEQTISCNGVIEAADGIGVFAPVACYISDVRVTAGQRVSKGDVLAVIDKEATQTSSGDFATQIALAAMDAELTAPEDGIIVEVGAEKGKTLKVGTPCVIIVRPCDLQIRIVIREKDLRTIKEGMTVRVSGDGLGAAIYDGTLSEISYSASMEGSVPMVSGIVSLDENQADNSFRLGLSAKAIVVTSVTEAGCLIPYEAVLADEEGSYVYLCEDDTARIYRVKGAMQMPSGLLLPDAQLNGACVILTPDKVPADGVSVTQVVS